MKTVLITGCSSGFGRELVSAYLQSDWKVIATLRNSKERSSIFAEEFKKHPDQLFVLELDVATAQDRKNTKRFIDESCGGKLDCLVNNAGYGLFGALENVTEEQFRHQMEVNFFGLAFLTRELLPCLRAAQGRVINVSSVLGYLGLPLGTPYCSSKFAVEGLSESLYHELKPHGVQVALVQPGGYRTRFMENIAWGETAFSPTSVYYPQTSSYKKYRGARADKQEKSASSADVSNAIVRASLKRKMPLRIRSSGEAHLIHLVRKILPDRAFIGLISFAYKKLINT